MANQDDVENPSGPPRDEAGGSPSPEGGSTDGASGSGAPRASVPPYVALLALLALALGLGILVISLALAASVGESARMLIIPLLLVVVFWVGSLYAWLGRTWALRAIALACYCTLGLAGVTVWREPPEPSAGDLAVILAAFPALPVGIFAHFVVRGEGARRSGDSALDVAEAARLIRREALGWIAGGAIFILAHCGVQVATGQSCPVRRGSGPGQEWSPSERPGGGWGRRSPPLNGLRSPLDHAWPAAPLCTAPKDLFHK